MKARSSPAWFAIFVPAWIFCLIGIQILNKPYNWEAPRVDVWLNNGAGPRRQGGTGAKGGKP